MVCTLPHPTGPMTQMRSPGRASKTMFLRVKSPSYEEEGVIEGER
jgi:hypothetical protein